MGRKVLTNNLVCPDLLGSLVSARPEISGRRGRVEIIFIFFILRSIVQVFHSELEFLL